MALQITWRLSLQSSHRKCNTFTNLNATFTKTIWIRGKSKCSFCCECLLVTQTQTRRAHQTLSLSTVFHNSRVADDKTRAGTEEKKLACRLVRCWVGEIVSVSQRGLYDSSTRVPWRHNSGEEPPHHPNKLRVRWVVQICHLWQSASAWPWQRGSLLCGKKMNKDVWGYCQIDF